MVVQRIYVYPVCKLEFFVEIGHSLVSSSTVTFSHGRLLLLARCWCELLSVNGELAVMFRHGRWMVSPHSIAGGLLLVDFDWEQGRTVFGSSISGLVCCMHSYMDAQMYLSSFDFCRRSFKGALGCIIESLGLAVCLWMIRCCSLCLIPRRAQIVVRSLLTKWVPLSLRMKVGMPWGMSQWSKKIGASFAHFYWTLE